MKRFIVSAVALCAIFVSDVSAGKVVPFKGGLTFNPFDLGAPFFDDGCGGLAIPIDVTGEGTATHTGRFAADVHVTYCLADGSSYGTATWIVANGDTLTFNFTGQDQLRGPEDDFTIATYASILEEGTGRFEGASGSLSAVQFRPDVGVTVEEISGFISSVGSTRSAHALPEPTSMSLLLWCLCGFAAYAARRTSRQPLDL
jgi:hypothetical protein